MVSSFYHKAEAAAHRFCVACLGLFYYIPQSALASIIISSVVTMVDYESPIIMWKVNPIDLIPYLLSFWLCLILDIKYGILAGVAANVCIVMYFTARCVRPFF